MLKYGGLELKKKEITEYSILIVSLSPLEYWLEIIPIHTSQIEKKNWLHIYDVQIEMLTITFYSVTICDMG